MTNTTEQLILSLNSAVSSTLAPVQFPETPELWATSFFFNSCKTLCSSVDTVSSWKMTDLPFFVLFCFLVFSFSKQDHFCQFLLKLAQSQPLLLRTHTAATNVQKPTALKWSQCTVSHGMNLFLFPFATKCMSLFFIMYSLIQPKLQFKHRFFILNKTFVQPDHLPSCYRIKIPQNTATTPKTGAPGRAKELQK